MRDRLATEQNAVQLRTSVLEREVNVPRGLKAKVGNLSTNPDRTHLFFQTPLDLIGQLANGEDAPRLLRGKEFTEVPLGFALLPHLIAELQPFATAVTGVEVVPEFHRILVLLPAEKNFLAADDGGKINQTTLKVLDLNLALLEFAQQLLHLSQGANPFIHEVATQIVSRMHQRRQSLVAAFQLMAQLIQTLEPLAQLRQQRLRFLAGVMFVEPMSHRVNLLSRH